METKRQEETNDKEMHLLEQKGYERMENEIVPVQQVDERLQPTEEVVEEAIEELNPDENSMNSRG